VVERALPDVDEEELGHAPEHAPKPGFQRRAAIERCSRETDEARADTDPEIRGAEQRSE
jgi:hypothetical protein